MPPIRMRENGSQVASVHVVPRIDKEASGTSYSVTRLCQSLIANGNDARLAVLDNHSVKAQQDFVRCFAYGPGPRRLGVSPRMKSWLREQARSGAADLIHNHSLWMMPNVYPGAAVRNTSCKLVISPRGTLSNVALKRSALVKKVFWSVLQRSVVASGTAFHATSHQEYEDIRSRGFTQPVAIIPNGVDVPDLRHNVTKQEQGIQEQAGRKRLLFLGRIHPIKGLSHLLSAWQIVQDRHRDWELVVAGPDNRGHLGKLEQLAGELKLQRCRFAGPVYGADKLVAYREADLYVLPTLSENFGMTVAEALAAGTPVITTRNAPWEGLQTHDAGWWIEGGVDALTDVLDTAMNVPTAELASKGQRGREWMKRDFSWDAAGQDMASFYDWILHGGDMPGFVQVT